jgi:methylated-DNA-[protein]-cysteine S-methyltransferase
MRKAAKYTIFKTKWGYFGLAGNENGLLRACLPLGNPEKVKSLLLISSEAPQFEKRFFKKVQDQITAYFEGACVNFSMDIPIFLDGLSDFCGSILTACRDIKFGQTVSYLGLAKKLGRPNTARAVGNALAKNPLPLIIPCHRVIRSDGKIGGFSATGKINIKAKLLKHEKQVLTHYKSD